MRDKRRWDRFALEVEVDLESEHNFYTGFTQNISAGGLFVCTSDPLAVGTTVEVHVKLPGAGEIVAMAVVRWVRDLDAMDVYPPGMGMQFIDLSPEAAKAIEEFVETRQTLFHPEDD